MAFDQFKTVDEKIQYVLDNYEELERRRIEKVDKKIEEYRLDVKGIYAFGRQQDLKGLRVLFSNLKHRYKWDQASFLTRYLNKDKKEQARELGEVGFTFYIAMMEEVCSRRGEICPDFIQEEENMILPVYFADPGCYAYSEDDVVTKESLVSSYEEALPVFRKHNLLIGDIDDVY